jgi:hypothetical protein
MGANIARRLASAALLLIAVAASAQSGAVGISITLTGPYRSPVQAALAPLSTNLPYDLACPAQGTLYVAESGRGYRCDAGGWHVLATVPGALVTTETYAQTSGYCRQPDGACFPFPSILGSSCQAPATASMTPCPSATPALTLTSATSPSMREEEITWRPSLNGVAAN